MRLYAKLIWENVLRYTLLDLLTASVLCTAFYFLARLLCAIGRVDTLYEDYAMHSIHLLSLIYVLSIMTISAYWHFRLMKLLPRDRTNTQMAEATQNATLGATEAGEDKAT